MTEQEAKRLEAIERVLTASINRLEAGATSDIDNRMQALFSAYDEGVKVGESKGGYRAGFAAGQAAASKTIAELQAQVAALKATVDQCRAAGFIDDAGNVRKVLGVLPLTADGCVAADNAIVYLPSGDERRLTYICPLNTGDDDPTVDVRDCYSTREAAEAARKAVKP